MANIKEAIALYLEDDKETQESIEDIRQQFMVPVSIAY